MKAKNFWTVVVILGVFLCGRGDARSERVCGSDGGVIGVILEDGGRRGIITGNYGSAIYGGEGGYDSEKYVGRARRGVEIELLDPNVMANEYGKPIVKIKIEEKGWRAVLRAIVGLPSDMIGWVNLRDTSFAEWFEDKAKVGAVPAVMGSIAEGAGRKGTVTGIHGCAIYGSGVHYSRRFSLGMAARGARIELLERDVIKNEFRMPIIKVKALEPSGTVAAGAVGWVKLSETSFAEWFEDKAKAGAVPAVVGTIAGGARRKGTVTGTYGCEIYGSGAHYSRRLNLGRLESGAKIELLERDVIENEFRKEIIKIKTLEASGQVAGGAAGWVRLSETSFAEWYESKGDGLRVERIIGKVLEIEGTKGIITGKYGAEMRGSNISYNPDLDLGRFKKGAQIELVDVKVIESKFGRPIIKVKALTGEWTVAVGSIGWVNLVDTSFANRFTEESEGGTGGGAGGVEKGESQKTTTESEHGEMSGRNK